MNNKYNPDGTQIVPVIQPKVFPPYPDPLPNERIVKRRLTTFQNQILSFEHEDDFIVFILNLENLFHKTFLHIHYDQNEYLSDILEYQKYVARCQFDTFDLSGYWYVMIDNGWDRHGNYESTVIIKLDNASAKDGREITDKAIQFELERQEHGAYLDEYNKKDARPSEVPNGKEITERYMFLIEQVSKLGIN